MYNVRWIPFDLADKNDHPLEWYEKSRTCSNETEAFEFASKLGKSAKIFFGHQFICEVTPDYSRQQTVHRPER
jgi:hypothetical protein